MTVCTAVPIQLQRHSRHEVQAQFDGARISSDGGALLLREIDTHFGILEQASQCFTDHRTAHLVEHALCPLLRQRIFGIALGYEDIADHDTLRDDSLLALACGCRDMLGSTRRMPSDVGKPLAAHATLHRLELARPTDDSVQYSSPHGANKITFDAQAGQHLLIDLYAQQRASSIPQQVILDLDATDSTIHGNQEGKWFNRYYDSHCYTPLYIFTDDGYVLWSELQTCDASPSRHSVHAVETIVGRLRSRPGWASVRFVVRGDSGFCRDDLMAWCENNDVGFVLGLQTNPRLVREIAQELEQNLIRALENDDAHATYHAFRYKTLDTWSRERHVSAKAEALPARLCDGRRRPKKNPRFVVCHLPGITGTENPELCYRQWYCPRGEMENRIKEQQLCLFADRVSTSWIWSNQLRQWFSTIAYVLLHAMRTTTLKGTELAHAQCSTIRNRLLKIGATIRVTTRRIWIHLSAAHPAESLFRSIATRVSALR